MPPPRLQWPASRIRPLSAVAPARGLDVEIYDEISEESCPLRVSAHSLPTGLKSSRVFFTYVFSDLRPMGGGRLPGRRRHCGGLRGRLCARICERTGTPRKRIPPRLRRELPSIKKQKNPGFLARQVKPHGSAGRVGPDPTRPPKILRFVDLTRPDPTREI